MQELALGGEASSVWIAPLLPKCQLFGEDGSLLVHRTHDVQSRVSTDSFRTFIGAIGGTGPDITDDNARGFLLLSGEFRIVAFLTAVAGSGALPA
jgi:hypothetical protein